MGHHYDPNAEDGDTISKNGGPSSNTPIGRYSVKLLVGSLLPSSQKFEDSQVLAQANNSFRYFSSIGCLSMYPLIQQ